MHKKPFKQYLQDCIDQDHILYSTEKRTHDNNVAKNLYDSEELAASDHYLNNRWQFIEVLKNYLHKMNEKAPTGPYGVLPVLLGHIPIEVTESMFYLYMPIKIAGNSFVAKHVDKRLKIFMPLIEAAYQDHFQVYGLKARLDSYMYLTVKHGYIGPGMPGNRPGYHSDGFLTDDINYIWCDANPTIFNNSSFDLTLDDQISLQEMEDQANPEYEITYPPYTLLRLDQYNIHKVAEPTKGMMRTFVKMSFSKDKYDLIGNTHNYNLIYDWEMKPRAEFRNMPQSK